MVKMKENLAHLAYRLITWQKQHGRHHLPWQYTQGQADPYRVWISEIMLQQTQVNTVISFFERFVASFPTINQLAEAKLDDVLALWSGLGYYTRAHHLHQTAVTIVQHYDGKLPSTFSELIKLPGIGRSTAAAILVFAFNKPYPILDGNVKRILSRYALVSGALTSTQTIKRLWEIAEWLMHTVPSTETATYTQGLMDLGSDICLRRNPLCQHCPLAQNCLAFQRQKTQQFPETTPQKRLTDKTIILLVFCDEDERILLVKRPMTGIWGGLWCFPEAGNQDDIHTLAARYRIVLAQTPQILTPFTHTLTHLKLTIVPIFCKVALALSKNGQWCKTPQSCVGGIPVVVNKIWHKFLTPPKHDEKPYHPTPAI